MRDYQHISNLLANSSLLGWNLVLTRIASRVRFNEMATLQVKHGMKVSLCSEFHCFAGIFYVLFENTNSHALWYYPFLGTLNVFFTSNHADKNNNNKVQISSNQSYIITHSVFSFSEDDRFLLDRYLWHLENWTSEGERPTQQCLDLLLT